MKNPYLYPCLIVVCVLSACYPIDERDKTETISDTTFKTADTMITQIKNAAKLDTIDVAFLEKATYGVIMEVESSAKILQTTNNAAIKTFAETVVKNHDITNERLKAIAENKGYILPVLLPSAKLALIKKMDSYNNEDRNEYYIQLMRSEYQQAIGLFSLAGTSANSEIAVFATTLLPTLQNHYQQVMKIDTALNSKN